MGDKSTHLQICNLLNNHELEKKDVLELGYLRQDDSYDLKDFSWTEKQIFSEQILTILQILTLHGIFILQYQKAPKLQFDYIVCSSVMEHVTKPWIAVKNVENVLKTGGFIIWATPWVWRIHGYPEGVGDLRQKGRGVIFQYDLGVRWL